MESVIKYSSVVESSLVTVTTPVSVGVREVSNPQIKCHIAVSEPVRRSRTSSVLTLKPSTAFITRCEVTQSHTSPGDLMVRLKSDLATAERDREATNCQWSSFLTQLVTMGLTATNRLKLTNHGDEIEKVARLVWSLSHRLTVIEQELKDTASKALTTNCSHHRDQITNPSMATKTTLFDPDSTEDASESPPRPSSPSLSVITLPDNLDDYPQIQTLISKRSKLLTQLVEAKSLRSTIIDHRTVRLAERIVAPLCMGHNESTRGTNRGTSDTNGDPDLARLFIQLVNRKLQVTDTVLDLTNRITILEQLTTHDEPHH